VSTYRFGQWLKWRRDALSLTQKLLAQHIGCSEITLRKLEAGERRPSMHIAELIAEALNVRPEHRPQFLNFARAGHGSFGTLTYWTATSNTPTNLTPPPTPLVGREPQVIALSDKFRHEDVRLLTLTGPPGIGKTRLALEVAARLLDLFEDGVYFVALDKIENAELIPSAIVAALGATVNGSQPTFGAVQRYLRDRHLLLVLDNFEHVVAASAQITDLLAACPFVRALVTSRVSLRLRSEWHYRVPPLEFPSQLQPLDTLLEYSAIALFAERARVVKVDFELTPENAPAILDICTRLDGLPLAIELIAAYVKLLSPQELVPLLSGHFILHSHAQVDDLADRHQTLIAAMRSSFQLLPAELLQMLMRLSVFLGGWTLEAAQAVCELNEVETTERLLALLDRSLIQQEKNASGATRFIMLMPVREYMAEQLEAAGLAARTRDQHSLYFRQLAEVAAHGLWGTEQLAWLKRLDADYSNLRAALEWSGQYEALLGTHCDIIGRLEWYWILRGQFQEGYRYARRALEHDLSSFSLVTQAWAQRVTVSFSIYTGDIPYALANIEAIYQMYNTIDDKAGMIPTLFYIAILKWMMGDIDQARMFWEQRLMLSQALEHPWFISSSHYALAVFHFVTPAQRDLERSRTHAEYALILARQLGNHFLIITSLIPLAYIDLLQDDLTLAQARFEESHTLAQQLGDPRSVTSALNGMAKIALRQIDPQRAKTIYLESLRIAHDIADKAAIIDSLVGLAQVFKSLGMYKQAAQLLATAQPNLDAMSLPPVDQAQFQRDVGEVRAQLGEGQFARAWESGKMQSWEQVSVKTVLQM
jgi:predicted ATPase/transcriptional regulator with XRE-family HTH domain